MDEIVVGTYYIVPNPFTNLIIMICMPNSSSLLDDLLSCQTIKITLKNEVLSNMKAYHGIYKKSASINGKPSWKSQSKAIWKCQNDWWIGNLSSIGKDRGSIYTTGTLFGANENGKWNSFIEKKWKKLDTNDFSIECIARKGTN